ncbi:hypothetical protein LCGC14_2906330 [marine sediment metagenome]|uniref:Uncharacterized protein n=1 Tax=marine sediment metagenome TaxID=412755 RepID=A0A0F8YEP5_9ZZZZ
MRTVMLWLGAAAFASGCLPAKEDPLYVAPLPVLQQRAYAEAVTGRFVSLADFEPSGLGWRPGHRQLEDFRITPAGRGRLKFVVNITRTGAGAMQADLPGGASLVWTAIIMAVEVLAAARQILPRP